MISLFDVVSRDSEIGAANRSYVAEGLSVFWSSAPYNKYGILAVRSSVSSVPRLQRSRRPAGVRPVPSTLMVVGKCSYASTMVRECVHQTAKTAAFDNINPAPLTRVFCIPVGRTNLLALVLYCDD